MILRPTTRKSGHEYSSAAQAPPQVCHYLQIYQTKLTDHSDGGYAVTENITFTTLVSHKRMQQEDEHEVVLAEEGKPPSKSKADWRIRTLLAKFLSTSAEKTKKK